MDLSSILPMLLNKNGGGDNESLQTLLKAMNGGGGTASVNGFNGGGDANNNGNSGGMNNNNNGNADPMQTMLKAMSGGGKPDIGSLLNLANMKKPNKIAPIGFKAIVGIAPNDILGCMIKAYL